MIDDLTYAIGAVILGTAIALATIHIDFGVPFW